MLQPYADIFLDRYRPDPVAFVREVIGAEPTKYQRRWLRAIAKSARVAIRSSRGPGKTTVAAWAILWFFCTRALSQVVVTAPTFDRHIKDRMWPELRKWIAKSGLLRDLIQIEKYHLRMADDELGERWFVLGTSSNDPGNMEGFHAPHLMFVVDEAKTVPRGIFKAITGSLSDNVGEQKLVLISTPAEAPTGYLYDCFSKWRDRWDCHSLSAFEAIEQGARISWQWIRDQADELNGGVVDREGGSPAWQAQVLGEFPDQGERVLIPVSWVERAVRRHPLYAGDRRSEVATAPGLPVEAGLDVSEGGTDKSILTFRQGLVLWALHNILSTTTQQTAGHVRRLLAEWNARARLDRSAGAPAGPVERLKVERTGPGRGVGDLLGGAEWVRQWYVPASRPRDRKTFHNLRAEAWWGLRALFEDLPIAVPDDRELVADLTAYTYDYTPRGRLVVVDKNKIRDELGRSPDKGDATMIVFANVAGATGLTGLTKAF